MSITPAPWDAFHDDDEDAYVVLSTHGCGRVCTVAGTGDEQRANACLLAEAPCLLAELRSLVAMVEREYAGFDAIPEWQNATATIARAEGRDR